MRLKRIDTDHFGVPATNIEVVLLGNGKWTVYIGSRVQSRFDTYAEARAQAIAMADPVAASTAPEGGDDA